MRGKLIVIDGTDGSGKATQVALLVKNLRKAGYKVKIEDFPRYGKKSAGLVEEYLNGKYGSAAELGPYIPSMFYAVDRFATCKEIKKYLAKGHAVVIDRYVTANMGHQGGKIKSEKEREKYFKWVFNLEYNFFKIPKPDLTLILHMPAQVAQKLANQRGQKRDLHEKDLKHLKDAEKAYLEIAKKFRYPVIESYKSGKVLSRQEIAKKIWKRVKKIL